MAAVAVSRPDRPATHQLRRKRNGPDRQHAGRGRIVLVGMTGFEPATLRSQSGCATKLRYIPLSSSGSAGASRWTGSGGRGLRTIPSSERVTGIEPAPSAWKAEVLPLNYTRRHTTSMGSPRCRLRVGLYRTSLPECQSHARISRRSCHRPDRGGPGKPRRDVERSDSKRYSRDVRGRSSHHGSSHSPAVGPFPLSANRRKRPTGPPDPEGPARSHPGQLHKPARLVVILITGYRRTVRCPPRRQGV